MTERVLGIDLGAKRIGVAVSDSEQRVATPLEVIARDRDPARHRQAIARLAREWECGRIVVGLPLSLDGSEGPAAQAARTEMEELASVSGLPVEPHDERLTTVTAERALVEQHLDARKRRGVVDMVAAAVLLQGWLDLHRPNREDAR